MEEMDDLIKTFWYVSWDRIGVPTVMSVKCKFSYGESPERVYETVGNDPHFGSGYYLSELGNNGVSPDKKKVLTHWRRAKSRENNTFLSNIQRNVEGIKALEALL